MSEDYCIIESEKLSSKTDNDVINLVLQTLDLKKQILIFNNSKRSSEKTAEDISKEITNIENKEKLEELSQKILKTLSSPTSQCKRLANCITKGIAFHHSGLLAKQRYLIEKYFKKGLIKVISSTPTLAAGLNLPAYKVIIKDYKRYSSRGMADIPILEFHQMSGRAGRPGQENIGKAVLCIKTDEEIEKVVPKYLFGESEEIISKLAIEPTLKMYILSLMAMDMINTKEEIKTFFSNTLYAHQYKDLESLNNNIFKIIEILKDYKFIIQDDDYYIATQLGKKISELYLNPDTANYFLQNLSKFVQEFQKENISQFDVYSLINFITNTIEMRPLFRVLKSEETLYIKKLEQIGNELVVKFDPFEMDYETFINTLKTTDILADWINEAPEDYISEKYHVTPGELNYKIEVMDWLLYCLEEIAYLRKETYFKNYLSKLRLRFKFGIKTDLLTLITLKDIGRVRARKLAQNGFKKLLDLKKAPIAAIGRVVGENIAVKIKNQIEEQNINNGAKLIGEDGYIAQSEPPKLSKPKEIRIREHEHINEEVSADEVDYLISNYNEFEKEKKERNMNLTDYF